MGCDIFWRGKQPDETRQNACTRFLASIAKDKGWEYESFDGSLPGPILSVDRWERHATEPVDISACTQSDSAAGRLHGYVDGLSVRGVVLYPEGHQRRLFPFTFRACFVFDNTDGAGELISLDYWRELQPSAIAYVDSHDHAQGWVASSRPVRGAYRAGGIWRETDQARTEWWCRLLLCVRECFVPGLFVLDDYEIYEEVEADAGRSGLLHRMTQASQPADVARAVL